MSEVEAVKAYRERLPVKTKNYDIGTGLRMWFEMPVGIEYERTEALMEEVSLKFITGRRSVMVINIEKLELCDGNEKEKDYRKISVFGELKVKN